MTQILRTRFGQPCSGSNCDNVVPEPRVRELRQRKEDCGLAFGPGDVVCIRCGFDEELRLKGVEPTRRR
jgi:hypothetical protein